jgi:replicative DNA helicase
VKQSTQSPELRLLCSIEEEKACLGAAMINARQGEELCKWARPDFFTCERNRLIFECMLVMKTHFEAALLAGELDRAGLLERAGGLSYLLDLDWGVVIENSMTLRIKRLRDLWCLRALERLGEEIQRDVREPLSTSSEVIAMIRERLKEIVA